MTTISSQLSQEEWTRLLTPQPRIIREEEPSSDSSCHYCGSSDLEDQSRYDEDLCGSCFDECIASEEADWAYDAWRDAQMGA